jgi:hypothetical protein
MPASGRPQIMLSELHLDQENLQRFFNALLRKKARMRGVPLLENKACDRQIL